jgi:chemosensory pili system protein ChpA (sensor histidine kinase/response regulator)
VELPENQQQRRQGLDGAPADLLESFLDEGRQAVSGIAAALAELATGTPAGGMAGGASGGVAGGGAGARQQLKLLTHRLRGSAALFGFDRMSRLAAAMEERADAWGPAGGPAAAAAPAGTGDFMAAAAAALARALDDIAAGGDDQAATLPMPAGAGGPAGAAGAAAESARAAEPAGWAESAGAADSAGATDSASRAESAGALESTGAAVPPGPAGSAAWRAAAALDGGTAADGVADELRRFVVADPAVLEYFGPEAEEHVDAMAAALAAIRQRGPAAELVALLFRAAHTLKGAAYTVGCGPIARLAHGMEDLLAALPAGSADWSGAALPALAEGVEALRLLLAATLAAAGDRRLESSQTPAEVTRSLSEIADGALLALAAAALPVPWPPRPASAPAPHGGPRAAGLSGAAELPRTAGPAAARPGAAELQAAAELPGAAELGVRLGALDLPGPSLPAAGAFRSSIRVSIERIDRLMSLVGELVITRARLDRRLERLGEIEELALAKGARMSRAVEEFGARHLYPQLQPAAAAGAAAPVAGADTQATSTAELFAELEFDRYDDFNLLARRTGEAAADLDELHGEIARLTTLLRDDAGQLQRLVRDLRGGIGRARMVPICHHFARFRRLVAATAAAAGKQVSLELEGETVEVDTAVAEAIADPLMHLVRNAVIHGIEPPEARRSRGKPEVGLLLLRAYLQGRFVAIEVEDDGGGIDVEALRRQAVALGLRTAAAVGALSREQSLELVFLPGLTTSPAVTQASGRGIGMDVVRTNLTRLGGEIAIETEAEAGSRFTLKAPLTLLISEALLVRVGAETFAIPVTAVRRMLHAADADLAAAAGGGEELLPRGGSERLPLLRLDRLFGLAGRRTEPLLPVVVLAAGGRACALAVDELLGVEEVVIKGLGELLAGLPLFSGAIVTAEGTVVLLLDAPAFTLDPGALAEAAAAMPTPAAAGASSTAAAPGPLAAGGGTALPGDAAVAGGAAGAAGAAAAPARAREVLLVDDSVSVRKSVGQMLVRHGYRVTTVGDGEEALEALRTASFDAVLTDLEMPRLNGFELIEEIRRAPGGRELPIVVITTRAGGKHLDLARQLGATACFGKPFDPAALLSLLGGLEARAAGAGAATWAAAAPAAAPSLAAPVAHAPPALAGQAAQVPPAPAAAATPASEQRTGAGGPWT